MTSIAIDLTDPEYRINSWPTYERLRDEYPGKISDDDHDDHDPA